jgi:ammonia channel protein AmtB
VPCLGQQLISPRQITPAIGFLYAGMHRRKAALTMIFQSLFCACTVGIQFWVYGYSLYQSHTTGPFIGDLSKAGLHNTLGYPSLANPDIPDILYACFGFTFVTCTAMILAGAMLERGRMWPSMLFLLCWTTFVYYVLAYAEWNPSGWYILLLASRHWLGQSCWARALIRTKSHITPRYLTSGRTIRFLWDLVLS